MPDIKPEDLGREDLAKIVKREMEVYLDHVDMATNGHTILSMSPRTLEKILGMKKDSFIIPSSEYIDFVVGFFAKFIKVELNGDWEDGEILFHSDNTPAAECPACNINEKGYNYIKEILGKYKTLWDFCFMTLNKDGKYILKDSDDTKRWLERWGKHA